MKKAKPPVQASAPKRRAPRAPELLGVTSRAPSLLTGAPLRSTVGLDEEE